MKNVVAVVGLSLLGLVEYSHSREARVRTRSEPSGGGAQILPSSVVRYVPADAGVLLGEAACATLAAEWVSERSAADAAAVKLQAIDLAVFLHVPRTAGRIIHHCVLKAAFSERCKVCYDALRVNLTDASAKDCGLLVSHHDFRIVDSARGHGRPFVLTMLRDPLGRVLSSYEFAVEVAARRVGQAYKCDLKKLCTRHVWPWTHLIPHFDAIMNTTDNVFVIRSRQAKVNPEGAPDPCTSDDGSGTCAPDVDARVRAADEIDEVRDPYDCSIYEPLMKFLEVDMVRDLLDNAATFQLLGLTELTPILNKGKLSGGVDGEDLALDVSATAERAAQLRRCTRSHGSASKASAALLAFALRRLEQEVDALLLHERLDDSVNFAASMLRETYPESKDIFGPRFQHCVANRTKKMTKRKAKGMSNLVWPDGEELWLGKGTRENLSDDNKLSILGRNWMDVALHRRATELFEARYRDYEESGKLLEARQNIHKQM